VKLYMPLYWSLPVPLQNLGTTVASYQNYRKRFTPTFYRVLAELEKSVNDPIELHHARQWQMLKRILEHAREHIPYYRFLPPVVETKDPAESIARTLERIPPLEKSVYRARSRDFLDRDIPARWIWQVSTSGTTGTALPIWLTPERLAEGHAAVWRQRTSFGVNEREPNFNFTGQVVVPLRQQHPPFWRSDHIHGETFFSILHMSPENLEAYIDAIHDKPARYVQGYPSVLHLVGRAMLDAGRPLPPGKIAALFTHSESLLVYQRESIEKAFGAPVRDYYHSTENVASMTACHLNHLHVDMEYGIVEVDVQEETDEYERGPLMVTCLGHPATLFVRYRIGDVGTRLKSPCPCGRPGDVFLDVDGRIEDYVVTPEGRLVGRLDHIFKEQYGIEAAQILQNERESVTVLVVGGSSFNERSEHNLVRAVRERLGAKMHVDIRLVDSIPREPNGKFRAVKSSLARIER
jgi:phenylacetate-CoA ligase